MTNFQSFARRFSASNWCNFGLEWNFSTNQKVAALGDYMLSLEVFFMVPVGNNDFINHFKGLQPRFIERARSPKNTRKKIFGVFGGYENTLNHHFGPLYIQKPSHN